MSDRLLPIETECVRLAGLCLEDKELAAHLGISPRTFGNHLHRPYEKPGVSDRRLAARRLSDDCLAGYLFPILSKMGQLHRRQSGDDGPAVRPGWFLPAPRRGLGGNHGPRTLRRLQNERRLTPPYADQKPVRAKSRQS